MSKDNDAPGATIDRRPAGFHEFVRELEAMGELDLEGDLDAAPLPQPTELGGPA